MPPKKGDHQKYLTAVKEFLKEADEWLEPLDAPYVYALKDIAKDLDANGINGAMLNQFLKVMQRLEQRKPAAPEPLPEEPPVIRDQLDIFLEEHGR